MNCDFFQDDNGVIWLFHATDILMRPSMKSRQELKEEASILEQQREDKARKEEVRRLEHAEWKELTKKQQEELKAKRNLLKEDMDR